MPSGVELATAWLALKPTLDGAQGEIAKQLGPEADKAGDDAGKRAGGKFSAGMKAGIAIGAAALAATVAKVFTVGMDELKLGETINAQTDQIAKNTGFTLATSKVNDYTLALSKLSGISEEDLQSAGNNVLKFGDVSEDTYKRAVSSINDLGGAGKDVAGVSEALGKALADPAAAASLLKRQGVLLNDEQKALIENFVATGDKASAQGVILDELEASYGGMAEAAGGTLTGKINILNNSFENLAGDLVTSLMPTIEGLVGMLQEFIGWLGENQQLVQIFAVVIGVLALAFVALSVAMWAASLTPIGLIIGAIIIAVIALVAAIVWLVMNWDQVWAWLMSIAQGANDWLVGLFEGLASWWNSLWTEIGNFFRDVWNNLVNWLVGVILGVNSFLTGVFNGIAKWWNDLWTGISNFFRDAWLGIQLIVSSVGAAFGKAFGAVADIVRGAFEGVVGVVKGVINSVIRVVNGAIDGINMVAGAVGGALGLNIHVGRIPMLAKGGTALTGGSVIVGEKGPELLNIPKGASVHPDIPDLEGAGLPKTMRLVVGDREFTAYVQEEALGVVTATAAPYTGGRRR